MINGYEIDAPKLIDKFEAISPSRLFAPVAQHLPQSGSRVIDIGAGTGAAAAWFAQQGQQVLAVEPVAAFRSAGKQLHQSENIEWVDDSLPDLSVTKNRSEVFDLVLLSAVWHHLNAEQRQCAVPNICNLMAAGGILVVSLRHGPAAPRRPSFSVSPEDLTELVKAEGLRLELCKSTESVQADNRAAGVAWTWMVFRAENTQPATAAHQA